MWIVMRLLDRGSLRQILDREIAVKYLIVLKE